MLYLGISPENTPTLASTVVAMDIYSFLSGMNCLGEEVKNSAKEERAGVSIIKFVCPQFSLSKVLHWKASLN